MISLVGSTDAGGFVTEATVALPDGVEDGDRLLLLASANDLDEIVSLPSGWAVLTEDEIGTDVSTYVFTRTADGEPADYTVTWEGEHWHFLNLIAVRGVSGVRSHEVANNDSASTINLPQLEAERRDALIAFGFIDEETSKSFPAALTEITNLPRGIISGWEIPGDGLTEAHTLTCGTSGHIAATAILLAAEDEPDPAVSLPITLRAELQITAGGWTEITDDVRAGGAGEVSIQRGRSDEASTADASSCKLTLDNRDGAYSPRNPASPYYGILGRNTPLRIGIVADDAETIYWRFAGEVSEWPVRWTVGEDDVTIPIEASGPLRRLNQGEPPQRDALRRYIRAHQPVAYWPLTDGESAVLAASDLADGYDMVPLAGPYPGGTIGFVRIRMDWQNGRLAPHLAEVAQTAAEFGKITGRSLRENASDEWAVDLVRAGRGGRDELIVTSTSGSGTAIEWRVEMRASTSEIIVGARSSTDEASTPAFTTLYTRTEGRFFTDQVRHLRLRITESGSESAWALYIDGALMESGSTSGLGAPRAVSSVDYLWDTTDDSDDDHAALGHVTVWDVNASITPPEPLRMFQALMGHQGERAGVRIQRISQEEGLPLRVVGDLEQTPPMGPQQTATPLDVMRDAEAVDDGLLGEARDEVALVYRTNRSRYNQHGGS